MSPEQEALIAELWRDVFGHPSAQLVRVLEDIARAGSVHETTFVPGDPHASAFMEGKRALALYILGRAGVPVSSGRGNP